MIKSQGFTIWVEPTGKLRESLTEILKALSQKFETLEFTPHVTLVGGIEKPIEEVLEKTSQIASLIETFEIELTGKIVCEENDWTRTMIVLVKSNPQLTKAYQTAVEVLEIEKHDFAPHISLMYSEDLSIELRQKAAQRLDIKSLQGKFSVDYLTLMNTNGKITHWRNIKEFALIR